MYSTAPADWAMGNIATVYDIIEDTLLGTPIVINLLRVTQFGTLVCWTESYLSTEMQSVYSLRQPIIWFQITIPN